MTIAARAQEYPRIGYLYPAGGQQGTTIEVTLGGRFLEKIGRVYVSGRGVEAHVVPGIKVDSEKEINALRETTAQLMRGKPDAATRKQIAANQRKISRYIAAQMRRQSQPALGESVTLEIKLAADAELGVRDIRIESPRGISNAFRFMVGSMPEVLEKDADLDPDFPESWEYVHYPATVTNDITLPAVANGQIIPREPDAIRWDNRFTPGDADRFRFSAHKGQRLVIAASARELNPYLADAVPGWFQATLTLYDAAGKEVAFNDDYRFHPDPVIFFEVPADGQYTVEIKDAINRGRADFVYRITIGELPFITSIFPLGARAGAKTTFDLTGWNLPAKPLTIDAPRPGIHPLSVRKDRNLSNSLPYVVDDLPECLEKEPNDTPQTAQAVTLPVIVNGRIDRPGDWDVFKFAGRAGQKLVAEVCARRLESPLDSVLELTDAAGKRLAFNDDFDEKADGLHTHHADSRIDFTLPADGAYFIRLGDAQRQGGPEYAYRLRLGPPRPDFELRIAPSCIHGSTWKLTPITVFALRKDGFTGPIEVRCKDSDAVGLQGNVVPEGLDHIRMTLAMTPMLAAEPVSLHLEGRATIDGKPVVHDAVGTDDMMQAFFYRHLVPAGDLILVPEDRGRFQELTRQAARERRTPASIATYRREFLTQWSWRGDLPVRIPVGATIDVRVHMSWNPNSAVELELSEPAEGITVENVKWSDRDLVVRLRADAAKAKPGAKGNLIANTFMKGSWTDKEGKTHESRNMMGPLPAMPFEIVGAK